MNVLRTIQQFRDHPEGELTAQEAHILDTIEAAYHNEDRDAQIKAAFDRNDMEEAARLMNGGDLVK